MRKKEFSILIIILVLATIILLFFDKPISVFFESIRNYSLDFLFVALTYTTNVFLMFFFFTTIFLWAENKSRWIFPLFISFLLSILIAVSLKIMVHRLRPFEIGVVKVSTLAFYFLKDNFNTWNFSFPSFESVLVFSALPILFKEFKKFKYVWLVFACLVATSRVYFGVHYISDVFAGAIIGLLIGQFSVYLEEKYGLGKKLSIILK